jgi:hypothetical protein
MNSIWERRIPSAAVSLLVGLEGLGKTLVTIELMARLTRGQLAGDRQGIPSRVVYVGIEDDWASVAIPRLRAAGADLASVYFVGQSAKGGLFSVEDDLPALEEELRSLPDVALVVIDPLDAHLGSGIDSHRKSEVQRSVGHIATLAQEHECGVLGIGHLNKNELSRDLLMRVIGSKGFTTSARSVLAVGAHPENENERLLVLRKSNAVDHRATPALRFKLEPRFVDDPRGGEPFATAGVAWLGEEQDVDADEILRTSTAEERTERDEAADWLVELLADGAPIPYRDVERLASEAGIARATLHRARHRAGVTVERDGSARGRPSSWCLTSRSVSSQSLTQPAETKEKPLSTGENVASDGLSSQPYETGTKGLIEGQRDAGDTRIEGDGAEAFDVELPEGDHEVPEEYEGDHENKLAPSANTLEGANKKTWSPSAPSANLGHLRIPEPDLSATRPCEKCGEPTFAADLLCGPCRFPPDNPLFQRCREAAGQ